MAIATTLVRRRAIVLPKVRHYLRRRRALLSLVLVPVVVTMLYPFWFMIESSLHRGGSLSAGQGYSFDAWAKLFQAIPVGQELTNSIVASALSIALILAVSAPAGYAFAKLPFRFSTGILVGIVAAMLVPLYSIIIPAYVNLSELGLLTGYWGAVLVYAGLGTPFAVFLLATYFRGLPDELIEAATVDGVGHVGAFLRIALPMAIPAFVTVTVLEFIQIWNDLLVGLLFLQDPGHRTFTVGLGILSSGRTVDIPVLMAGSLLSTIPAVIVFLIFQRQLVNGLTAGIGK